MRSRFTHITLCLALGAALNTAVAWLCCLWPRPLMTAYESFAPWPRAVTPGWDEPSEIQWMRGFGLRESSALSETSGPWRLEQGKQYILECGFPWLALQAVSWREESRLEHTPLRAREPRSLSEGMSIPHLAPWLGIERVALPVMPRWPGFLLGAFFYGSILALARREMRWITRRGSPTVIARCKHAAACGAIGCALTVLVSWAPTAWPWEPQGEYLGDLDPTAWPCGVPPSWPRGTGMMAQSLGGVELRAVSAYREFPARRREDSYRQPERRETFFILQSRSGWPLAALHQMEGADQVHATAPGSPVRLTPLDMSWLHRGVRLQYPGAGRELRLPLAPIWPGFIADSILYTAAARAIAAAAADARLRSRRRRGLCITCGYHLAGLSPATPCPECGTPSSPARGDGGAEEASPQGAPSLPSSPTPP